MFDALLIKNPASLFIQRFRWCLLCLWAASLVAGCMFWLCLDSCVDYITLYHISAKPFILFTNCTYIYHGNVADLLPWVTLLLFSLCRLYKALTSQQHLVQQVVYLGQAAELDELELLDHLPGDALQGGQQEQQLPEATPGVVLAVVNVVLQTHLNLETHTGGHRCEDTAFVQGKMIGSV